MDFPNDIATNVYKIDGIQEIHWAFYSKACPNGVEQRIPSGDTDVHSTGEEDPLAVEHNLRQQGRHVCLAADHHGLWIFSLSEAEKGNVSKAMTSGVYKLSSAGSLKSADLANNSNLDAQKMSRSNRGANLSQLMLGGVGVANSQSFGSNAAMATPFSISGQMMPVNGNEDLEQHSHNVADIYRNFISAFTCSLSHSLMESGDWLPIGCRICIDTSDPSERHLDYLESESCATSTAAAGFEVQWIFSGTLTITTLQPPIFNLRRVSEMLSVDKELSPLADGPLVLLSPSGLLGRFCGIDYVSDNDQRSRSTMAMKSSVLARLRQQGLPMSQKVKWVRLRLLDHDLGGKAETQHKDCPPDSLTTLWPAPLCLCAIATSSYKNQEIGPLSRSAEEELLDPLARAESWFLGKTARGEAIEAKRRKDEFDAEKLKEHQGTDDEDALSENESQSQLIQYNTPHDASGIYPTPPDGLRSQVPNGPASAEERLTNNDFDNDEDVKSNNDETNRQYGEHENEDLFGDMDIDMFASNGLTDADFSFFDEPGIDGDGVDEVEQNVAENGSAVEEERSPFLHIAQSEPGTLTALPGENQGCLLHVPSDSSQAEWSAQQGTGQCSTKAEDISLKQETKSIEDQVKDVKDVKDIASTDRKVCDTSEADMQILDKNASNRPATTFGSVPFRNSLFNIDSKYGIKGRFNFGLDDLPRSSDLRLPSLGAQSGPPQIGARQDRESTKGKGTEIGDSDEETSVDSSDFHDERGIASELEGSSPQKSLKRKREQIEPTDHPSTPRSPESAIENTTIMSKLAQPSIDFFTPKTEPIFNVLLQFGHYPHTSASVSLTGKDRAFIQVAQILADQAVFGIDLASSFSLESGEIKRQGPLARWSQIADLMSEEHLQLPIKRCTLKDYVAIGNTDGNSLSKDRLPLQPKPSQNGRGSNAEKSVFKVQAPYTSVKRTDIATDLSPSAIPFWEELSLRPFHDSKNVTAFCVYPDQGSLRDGVATFLEMIGGTYQSCNLGKHNIASGLAEYPGGLVPVPMITDAFDGLPQGVAGVCKRLGTSLAQQGLQGGNTVIYMIFPFVNQKSLPEMCAAFLKIFDNYRAVLKDRKLDELNDIVFQIVPPNLVFSSEYIPMPSLAEYKRLAFEVYDRCVPGKIGSYIEGLQYLCTPAIRLAKAVPKAIDFRLTPDSSATCLQSDNCVHLAYVWDPGDSWLTASWIDNHGVLQWNACYCFRPSDEAMWLSFSEIAREIWETTFEMLQPRQGPWRLIIVKEGSVLKTELEVWQTLFVESSTPSTSYTFLTLDANPPVAFSMLDITNRSLDQAPEFPATPGATPQASALSPDISGLSSTPGGTTAQATSPAAPTIAFGDHDADARLVDITDETWGITLERSVDDLSVPSEFSPALASGYLVKRAGPRDEDGLVPLGVNIIHGQKPLKPKLKEVLGMYRNLGTLAKVRGIVDPLKSVVPWHVAAARKAHAAVNTTMRYEDV